MTQAFKTKDAGLIVMLMAVLCGCMERVDRDWETVLQCRN